MGDIFEHLLEEVKESGKNGQFRTPRQIIRFMVELLDPDLGDRVIDPACGSGGFLLNTLLHWKAQPHRRGSAPARMGRHPARSPSRLARRPGPGPGPEPLRGYDNDRTMVRIAWMNLLLHDLETPEIHQLDSLSKRLTDDESGTYDYILANPPFTGSVDEADLSENRQRFPYERKASPSPPRANCSSSG